MGIDTTCSNEEWLDEAYKRLLSKMHAQCGRIGTMIPYSPKKGKYFDCAKVEQMGGVHFWTNGFWPGMLWQMYEATGDELYRETACGVEERLNEILTDLKGVDHDAGFLFLPSAVADYRKTGNALSLKRGLQAANLLAGRFNPCGNFIRAWADNAASHFDENGNVSGWMIVDCMMNNPLLYWASDVTKDPRFSQMAARHAKTAQKYIVREDGSCNHIVELNPDTGDFVNNPGGQGFCQGSSWSRGQSWAVYGFALSYRHTGEEDFLNTAKRCAHYCIANLAVNDWLPLVDYRAPETPRKYDSTAGMITAAGLLELAEHVGEYEKNLYVDAAYNILRACENKFANWDNETDSIIDGGTFFYHDEDGRNTEVPIIYGDYFFIEAVLRLKGKSLFIW